nr:hypothetical protein [Tanacetum cinerariifolium]
MSAVDRRLTLDESALAKEVKSDSPLFLDELQGNAIHCSARSNVAYNFIKLKEGVIYCIKNFVVHPNKKEYHIRKDDAFMLEFNGATSDRKSLAKGAGFVRHPFQLVKLDSVELTENKYMIEKLYLSSNSSTQIFDDPNILALKELRSEIRVIDQTKQIMPVDFGQPRAGTLENLLLWARNRQNESVAFIYQVRIDNIRTHNGWNFLTCGVENCKKGVGRKLGGWWCDACEKTVEYPVLRYMLELGIFDATVYVVVVMFDERASELVKCSADSLAQSNDEFRLQYLDDTSGLPATLANIIEVVVDSASSSTIDVVRETPGPSRKRLCKQAAVATPLKATEGTTPISLKPEDSDADSLPIQAGRKKNQRVSQSE